MKIIEFETERLSLRQWHQDDFADFAALNADQKVMEYFPAPLTRAESDQLAQRNHDLIAENGWGLWATERKKDNQFIGFVGLHKQTLSSIPNAPLVEIGWRLAHAAWGCGYAPEAARGALKTGFEQLELDAIYSFTALSNQRSESVMKKLGMHNTHENFDHPSLPTGHPLQRHCLYKISRSQWQSCLP